jgi:LPS-assembly protein
MPLKSTRKCRNHALYLIVCITACLPLLIHITGISRADAADIEDPSTTPWLINADRIEYDQTQQQYTAIGNVTLSRQDRTLTAENVQLNQKTRLAVAQGNVRLVSGQDILSGDRLQINMDSETGTLSNGTLFINKNHLYLSGSKIDKTGPQTYEAENISVTSCDGDDPAWKLTGQDFKVTIEGYGYAKHTALWAGKIPLLYSPFLLFPVKLKRQSGLLMPEIGYADRKGTHYLQPLYWAINDSSDATLYVHYMSMRGVRTGLEYRYVLDESSLGTVMADGFQDFRIDDGLYDNSERWGYEDDDDDVLRTNKDRYWVRMKHDQGYDSGVTVKLDIDVVSDQDYLQEFKSGYNGFYQTQEHFQDQYGRDIDDYNDPVRLNRLNINRTWGQYSFNTDLRWYDDVILRRGQDSDDTLQQLPEITLGGVKQTLAGSPVYFDITSSYTHFYRINGTRGHRTDIYPRFYYPTTLWQYFTIEPSVGLRQTAWHVDQYETQPDHDRDTLYRAIYDFQLEMSTEIFRTYDFRLAGSDRLKHALIPEIEYAYIPEQDQSDFPEFDDLDVIDPENLITYGFTNIFTARAPDFSKKDPTAYSYNAFLRFKLSQSFDIDKERDGDSEPFSAILAELDLTPGRYVALDMDAEWSPYDDQFDTFSSVLKLWDLRGDSLEIDYEFTSDTDDEDDIESIRLAGVAVLSSQWQLRAGYEYNLSDDKEIESSAGFSYTTQCWGVEFDYLTEEGNNSFSIMFNLAGLASIGS